MKNKEKKQAWFNSIGGSLFLILGLFIMHQWLKVFGYTMNVDDWSNKLVYLMTIFTLLSIYLVDWSLNRGIKYLDRGLIQFKKIRKTQIW